MTLFLVTFNQVACCQMSCVTIQNCRRTAHLHVYNRNPVENIADDLVAQLSELLASATRLIETTTESLEELTEKESKLQKGLQTELKEQEEQKEEVCLNN